MSMVLLVGAALFARAEDRTLRADPGYLPQKVAIAPLFLPDGTRLKTAAVRLLALAERVKALPGARSVAFSEGVPLFDRATAELRPPERTPASLEFGDCGGYGRSRLPLSRGHATLAGRRALLTAEIPDRSATGKPGPAPSDRRAPGLAEEAAEVVTAAERVPWAWPCGVWLEWRSALVIAKPETVLAWHRKGFFVPRARPGYSSSSSSPALAALAAATILSACKAGT
jgi:hypothetical protein